MTYHHNTPSRVSNSAQTTPRAYLIFYSLLDALAFIFGVMLGALALGRVMAWYFLAND